MAMTLSLAKRLPQRHAELASGEFDQQTPSLSLEGAVCAILGSRRIGKRAAALMRAFGARNYAVNTSGQTTEPVEFVGTLADLDKVLPVADVLVICLPLIRATHGIIGDRELARMKPSAILVNVARAGSVVEGALYEHLREHPNFSAGIDTWWHEPPLGDDFRTDYPFFDLPNVLGSPHNSAIVAGWHAFAARHAAANVRRYLQSGSLAGWSGGRTTSQPDGLVTPRGITTGRTTAGGEHAMEMGMVGLGRMGANMIRRLTRAGHECHVYDVSADAVRQLASEGAHGATSLPDLVHALEPPRVVWLMLPAAITGDTVTTLLGMLDRGDTIVDGGNSYYRDAIDRAAIATERGVYYVDCGTSGGIWGLERGYCLMIGGEPAPVQRLDPIFAALAAGLGTVERTPGRIGAPAPAEQGYLHCGPPGAGHFVKMVHNGIEYALMAAYAEGLDVIRNAGVGVTSQEIDAETAPLRDPRYYPYDGIDLADVAEVWRRGSVVGSWLLDLTAEALLADPELDRFAGRVSDSGEGRWTSIAAIEEGVPATLLTAALYSRFASRGSEVFADKVQSAQRRAFGGHVEKDALS